MNFIYGLVHFNLMLFIMAIIPKSTQLAVFGSDMFDNWNSKGQLVRPDKPDNTSRDKSHEVLIIRRDVDDSIDWPQNVEMEFRVNDEDKPMGVLIPVASNNPTPKVADQIEIVPQSPVVLSNWQFVTLLRFDGGIKTLYMGVLIKSNIVLTVAQFWDIKNKSPGINLEVVFDIFDKKQKNIMKIISSAVHPEFHYTKTFGPVNDIAVIKLQSSVNRFYPVPLPESWMELQDQTQCLTIGYILNNTQYLVVELTQMVTSCAVDLSASPVNFQICTLFINKAYSIEFFRGAPLMCNGFLYGLFSYGPYYTPYSSESAYMAWTRVETYFPWATYVVDIHVPSLIPERRHYFEEYEDPNNNDLHEELEPQLDFLNRSYKEGMWLMDQSGGYSIALSTLWVTGLFVNLL